MNNLQTPFETALEIAWSDGRFSLKSARLLERLQKILHINDTERGIIEEQFTIKTLPTIDNIAERGNGLGDSELEKWIDVLESQLKSENIGNQVATIARSSLELGISKEKYILAMRYCGEIGVSAEFARTIWEEGEHITESKVENEILNPLIKLLNI